mgnify:CR=1 FL=1
MRKLLLLLFLLSLSSNVLAIDSWEYIAQSEDKGTFIYIYADKMKKENEFVSIWTLLNFKEPDKQGNLSNLIYMKFDCKWYRYKNLKYSFHKKPKGIVIISKDKKISIILFTMPSSLQFL